MAKKQNQAYKAGDKVEIVGNTSGHNQIGMEYEVAGYNQQYVRMTNNMNFFEADLRLCPLCKSQIQKRFEEVSKEALVYKEQLAYLEESNSATLDRDEFKKWALAKVLSSKLTVAEKTDRIHAIYS